MYLVIIGLIIVLVFIYITYYKNNNLEQFQTDENMLFTAYKDKLDGVVCSKWMDFLPKHMRINESGGVMYTSNFPPSETLCHTIKCPSSIVDDITPNNYELIDHYDSKPNNNNLTCWSCHT